jgi:hypothetical protein
MKKRQKGMARDPEMVGRMGWECSPGVERTIHPEPLPQAIGKAPAVQILGDQRRLGLSQQWQQARVVIAPEPQTGLLIGQKNHVGHRRV